jgi:peptide/nickel transport system substrate-binding protein
MKTALIILSALLALTGCSRPSDPNSIVMLIENSPTNLDPRVGTDAQSERIDELMFDALLRRDDHFNLLPALAERWENPDPLTYVFHLQHGVKFHDGRPLTSKDVKWTLDSVLNGTIRTPKTAPYKPISSIEAPDETTVVIHLKEPYVSLLWNLSEGAIGIVPAGSGPEFNQHPIGSGPFRFVSQEQDKEVVLERDENYRGVKPSVARLRFAVVPDATTRILELRKGSADLALNAMTADAIQTIRKRGELDVQQAPGTIYYYLAMNLRDPILKDVQVRRALAYAIDREAMVKYLMGDQARLADSILPPQHWAHFSGQAYFHDPAKARAILDQAGYGSGKDGIRFHIVMKTSTEESTRLLSASLQQQLREVGIALDIRSFEFATFFSDVTKGEFQLFSLRWIGGNEDPDIFEVFNSAKTPPKGSNRGFYRNTQLDALIAQGRSETDQTKRKQIYDQVQKIVSNDLPYINLWWGDNVLVHSKRLADVELSPSGNYNFLTTAHLKH